MFLHKNCCNIDAIVLALLDCCVCKFFFLFTFVLFCIHLRCDRWIKIMNNYWLLEAVLQVASCSSLNLGNARRSMSRQLFVHAWVMLACGELWTAPAYWRNGSPRMWNRHDGRQRGWVTSLRQVRQHAGFDQRAASDRSRRSVRWSVAGWGGWSLTDIATRCYSCRSWWDSWLAGVESLFTTTSSSSSSSSSSNHHVKTASWGWEPVYHNIIIIIIIITIKPSCQNG